MLIYYDMEVLSYDWVVVFKEIGQYNDEHFHIIHNDIERLKKYIRYINDNKNILVGFNNYYYDDKVIAAMLAGESAYDISKRIINNDKVDYKLSLITLDVIQELPLNVGLKSSQANLGKSIVETPVDFNINRKLTKCELDELIKYCINDVNDTEMIFKIREDYFKAKFEVVNEFNLKVKALKNTRAVLASKVLKCNEKIERKDRLIIDYDKNINLKILPNELVEFYKKCEYDYKCGGDYKEIENRKLKIVIAGVPHVYAFGGIHGAVDKYNAAGNFLHIDVSSYYPSLIINNNYMSRNSLEPEMFRKLRDKRYEYKANKDSRQGVYKIIINATFGAMKSEYNKLYDPRQANNICINGQLILTQLLIELEPYCQIIQSNTDGIIIKYDSNYDKIIDIVKDFGKRFNISFDVDKIIKIAQRDVNNYAIQFENGKIEAKGRFKNFEAGNFMQNTLSIIDRSLVNYYIHNKPIHETVIEAYKNNDLLPFQIVCKMGNTYDGMYYEFNDELIKTQKVNRVFATNDKRYGGIFKRKGDSYQKIANTSENSIIHNDDIKLFDKTKLDLNYYINLCKKNLY